jgi:hypothetical protein
MEDHDLNAARRNLILISLAFILFVLGDGSIVNPEGVVQMNFPLGAIRLNNPRVIYIFAWVLFAWFSLRFSLLRDPPKEWRHFVVGVHNTYSLKTLSRRRKVLWLHWTREDTKTHLIIKNRGFGPWRLNGQNDTSIELKPLEELPLKIMSFLEACITQKDFSQYYFPYLLAATAFIFTITWRG